MVRTPASVGHKFNFSIFCYSHEDIQPLCISVIFVLVDKCKPISVLYMLLNNEYDIPLYILINYTHTCGHLLSYFNIFHQFITPSTY